MILGIERNKIVNEIELSVEYPSELARKLRNNEIDVALMPVAAMRDIEGARIVSNYGIAADGKVNSVCLYSRVPLNEIHSVYLDYQSRTSVRLVQLLFEKHWKKDVSFIHAPEDFIERILADTAGVIIGDRALIHLSTFPYVYDLATAWKDMTGLPFVFAAWISNKELPQEFIAAFDEANAEGMQYIDEIVAQTAFPYDLKKYYSEDIHYFLDADKRKGLELFLSMITE